MVSFFRGGVYPPGNKHFTENSAFTNLSIPHRCYIPLRQHEGAAAVPVVSPGDIVKEGALIGTADGFASANVHASIPGRVTEISMWRTVRSLQPVVVIEAEGSFNESAYPKQAGDWAGLGRDEILSRIREAGIVGLGGSWYPASVKLFLTMDKKIDTLVINGTESEPYLTVDDMLMRTHPAEIIEGIRIALKTLGIQNAVVGIGKDKKKALGALRSVLMKVMPGGKIKIRPLGTKYPQGDEKQIIKSLLNRTVPSGGTPADAGAVVLGVGTVFAIREAVRFKKPLFERYLTVSGSLVAKPGNYKVRIGTRIADIIADCGGLKGDPAMIIMGGPMRGTGVSDMNVPVEKGTAGILFLSRSEARGGDHRHCIRCGRCVKACPMNLLPYELASAAEQGRFDRLEQLHPMDCIGCGACAFSCPSKRPLTHFIAHAQEKIKNSSH